MKYVSEHSRDVVRHDVQTRFGLDYGVSCIIQASLWSDYLDAMVIF